MKTYQNFEEIIISPGLMVLTRTQCTQFTSPPSWRGRQLSRWLNCFRWLMIILYSSSSYRSQVRLKIKSWWFTKLLMTEQQQGNAKEYIFIPLFRGSMSTRQDRRQKMRRLQNLDTLHSTEYIFIFLKINLRFIRSSETSRPRTSPISWQKIWITYCCFIIAVIVEGRVKTGLECTKR